MVDLVACIQRIRMQLGDKREYFITPRCRDLRIPVCLGAARIGIDTGPECLVLVAMGGIVLPFAANLKPSIAIIDDHLSRGCHLLAPK